MKATDQIDAETSEQKEQQEQKTSQEVSLKIEPLVKTDLDKSFDIKAKSSEYLAFADTVDISTKEVLIIAENKSSEINTVLKNIEKVRKALKQPHVDAGRLIDEHAKKLSESFAEAKEVLNKKLSEYKQLEEAQARAEAAKAQAELAAKEEKKNKEKDLVTRIAQQINARIFGGSYLAKDGTTKTSAGCNTLAELEGMITIVNQTAPRPETFEYFKEEVARLYETSLVSIEKRKQILIDIESDNAVQRKEALKKADSDRVNAESKSTTIIQKADAGLNKSLEKDKKAVEKSVSEAGKGLRKKIIFVVEKKEDIPENYKSVDERLVNAFIDENRDIVYQAIIDGEILIPGIIFSVDENYISR